jgi:hypothetical protein
MTLDKQVESVNDALHIIKESCLMPNMLKAIPWALAIVMVAIGGRAGIIDDATGRTMLAVLPILGALSLRAAGKCRLEASE